MVYCDMGSSRAISAVCAAAMALLATVAAARVPLVAPAAANAVFALTGKRILSLPLEDAGITFA